MDMIIVLFLRSATVPVGRRFDPDGKFESLTLPGCDIRCFRQMNLKSKLRGCRIIFACYQTTASKEDGGGPT